LGDVDLVACCAVRELGLAPGATELALTGRRADGTPIRGTDPVVVE
jgi:hypothetical protein